MIQIIIDIDPTGSVQVNGSQVTDGYVLQPNDQINISPTGSCKVVAPVAHIRRLKEDCPVELKTFFPPASYLNKNGDGNPPHYSVIAGGTDFSVVV
jgi:hypothetical protein